MEPRRGVVRDSEKLDKVKSSSFVKALGQVSLRPNSHIFLALGLQKTNLAPLLKLYNQTPTQLLGSAKWIKEIFLRGKPRPHSPTFL